MPILWWGRKPDAVVLKCERWEDEGRRMYGETVGETDEEGFGRERCYCICKDGDSDQGERGNDWVTL